MSAITAEKLIANAICRGPTDERSHRPNNRPGVLPPECRPGIATARRSCLSISLDRHVQRRVEPRCTCPLNIAANPAPDRSAPAMHRDRHRPSSMSLPSARNDPA